MRARERVPISAALSDKLCEISGAAPGPRAIDVGVKRASSVEGASWMSVLLLLLLAREPRTERPADEERRWEGRAVSLSELVI